MGKQEDAAAEWEIYKAEIRRLYLVEGRQLSEVEALMKREHNFDKRSVFALLLNAVYAG